MHIFPMTADIDLNAHELVVNMTPWGSPRLLGLTGEDKSENPQKHLIVVYEWPFVDIVYSGAISKFDKEKIHLDKALTDMTLATGVKRIDKYEEGGDPPDFVIYRDGKACNLDLVQFTYSKRRKANAMFAKIKEALYKCGPNKFFGLTGTSIYINFGTDGRKKSSLPFRTIQQADFIDKLFVELSKFKVERKKWEFKKLPAKFSKANQGESEGGAGFNIGPLGSAMPATPFFYKMGFEIGLAYYSRMSVADAWEEIYQRVNKHDKESIEEILISAGAPSDTGLCFPSDETFMMLALDNPPAENRLKPKYVKGVAVHIWSTGAIWEIYPEFKMITKGLCSGLSLSHYSVRKEFVQKAKDEEI